jgi:ATP-dependent DNA helicase RecQ
MGIDKPNIRYTVHMNLPHSIEAFYQEAGRAGRDDEKAECSIIVSHDFPNRTRGLLDPKKSLEEVALAIDAIPYGDQDDITRSLFLHVTTFKGIKDELEEVKNLLNNIVNLNEEKKIKIPYEGDENKRIIREKAIHRLVIIGVIKDYTINYSSNEFEVFISGNPPGENLESYLKYLGNYDKKISEQARKVASQKLTLPHREFILFLAEKLIKEFIYNIIELSRRRSLNEMLQACITNPTDEGLRSRILSYLELGHFSEDLENVREHTEDLSSILLAIFNKLDSPMEANELRGQTARMLEGYPNNPAFLLIRSLAEVFCPDRNLDTIFENFNAFLSFSTSSSGWGMATDEVIKITSIFINQIGETHPQLAQDLVVATLEAFSNDPEIARLLLKEIQDEFSLFPAFFLINHLSQEIDQIIKS